MVMMMLTALGIEYKGSMIMNICVAGTDYMLDSVGYGCCSGSDFGMAEVLNLTLSTDMQLIIYTNSYNIMHIGYS